MKKNQIILVFVLVLLIIIINYFIFFNKGSKNPIQIPTDFLESETSSNFNNINYSGNNPYFPVDKLPLLKIEQIKIPILEHLNNYCQTYNNQENFSYGNICDYNTHFSKSPIEVYFHDYSFSSNIINIKSAINTGFKFIEFFYELTNSPIINTSVLFYEEKEDNYEYLESNSKSANLATTSYNYSYQQIPIFSKNAQFDHIKLLINSDNKIIKAFLYQNLINIAPINNDYQLLEINTALKNIEQQKAYLLSFSETQDYLNENYSPITDFNLNLFTSVNLNSVKLEYRYADDNLAIPVYRFSGTAIDLNQNELSVEIITPAINFTVSP